jgi:hypothetical protein
VALAFWAAWLLGEKQIGFLIPAIVLTFVSVIVFGAVNYSEFFVPIILILVGVIVIVRGQGGKGSDRD